MVQSVLHKTVTRDGKVRRGNVERLAGAQGKKLVQRIRHAVLLVVDDEGKNHGAYPAACRFFKTNCTFKARNISNVLQ